MGSETARVVTALTGSFLLVLATVLVLNFPRVRAARRWAFSWILIAVGCAEVALAPLLVWSFWDTTELVIRTGLVIGSGLALDFGFLVWLPPHKSPVRPRVLLWLGLALALVPPFLGWTQDNPFAWAWTAGWAVVPVVVAMVVAARGLREPHAIQQAQARAMLWALGLGPLPFVVSWVVLPAFGGLGWGLGLPPFLLVGAALMTRALVHHDTRFGPEKATTFLVEKALDGVVFLQSEGRIQEVNPAFRALLDQDQGLRGQPISLIGADDATHRALVPLEALRLAEWEGAIHLTHRTGKPVPVHLVYRRIHNPAREAVGAVILLHDLRHTRRVDLSHREDPVTGLANRRWTMELLETEFQRVRRYGGPLTALWMTIGGLDDLRARAGAEAGDDVLRRVGGILKGGLRRTDFSGRVEQAELMVVLPETSADRGELVAHRLERMFALALEGEAGVSLAIVVGALAEGETTSGEFVTRLRAESSEKSEPV